MAESSNTKAWLTVIAALVGGGGAGAGGVAAAQATQLAEVRQRQEAVVAQAAAQAAILQAQDRDLRELREWRAAAVQQMLQYERGLAEMKAGQVAILQRLDQMVQLQKRAQR